MARIIDPTTYVTTILNLCKQQNEATKTWVQTVYITQIFKARYHWENFSETKNLGRCNKPSSEWNVSLCT